jgi:hypothetical protein
MFILPFVYIFVTSLEYNTVHLFNQPKTLSRKVFSFCRQREHKPHETGALIREDEEGGDDDTNKNSDESKTKTYLIPNR